MAKSNHSHHPPISIESIKEQSNYLRGQIAAELAAPTDHFSPETAQLLKYHGLYQQEDRDRRVLLGDPNHGKQKRYQFMVRTGVPGGRLTSQQLLAHLELADKYGNGTLRITSRQDLQLHGLAKADLRAVIQRIHEVGLTTMATAGDVHRNVVCCPAPYRFDPVHGQMQWMAGQIAAALAPQTPAYGEIWFNEHGDCPDFRGHRAQQGRENETVPFAAREHDGQQNGHEVEPLYGKNYLPRKLKVGIGLPGDNCADVYSQDIGLLAICRNYDVIGYNVLSAAAWASLPVCRQHILHWPCAWPTPGPITWSMSSAPS
jgi:sulfite reductase (ferredoxin)